MKPAFVINGLEDAVTALRAARAERTPIAIISAPAGAAFMGAGMFREIAAEARRIVPDVDFDAILDCGDAPGHALNAIRQGIDAFSLTAPDPVLRKIDSICGKSGCRRVPKPTPALELPAPHFTLANCISWIKHQK